MSLQLNTFNFEGQTSVRTVLKGEEPWFVAADVCAALGHSNAREAIRGLDEDERGVSIADTPGGPQELNLISESGLYTLILRSRKPQARAFRRWVTHEVLPALRRTGGYQVKESIPAAGNLPRVIQWDGQPWVCALDLLDACGYIRCHNTLDRVPLHMRGTALMPTGGGEQVLRVVSLAGVACFAERGRNRDRAKAVLAWMRNLGDSIPKARVKPMGVKPIDLPALLPPGPGAQSRPLFVPKAEDRAEFAEEALLHHDTIADARDLRFRHDLHMTNLLADLMHLADREGLDYAAIHQRAITHYQSEVRA